MEEQFKALKLAAYLNMALVYPKFGEYFKGYETDC